MQGQATYNTLAYLSTRYLLENFASALLRFTQVAYE